MSLYSARTNGRLQSSLSLPDYGLITFSVERNTVRLEGHQTGDDPDIRPKVLKEIEHSKTLLASGVPLSITCYVGGIKCTKQAEMMHGLLAHDHGYARLITPHLTCNYSVDDTKRYLRELHEHDVTSILAVSGDKLDPAFKTFSRESGLKSAKDLVALARDVEQEMRSRGSLAVPFDISVAYSSFKGKTGATEQLKLDQKIAAGANGVKTQPLTYADFRLIERDLGFLSSRISIEDIGFSVILYQSIAMAENMQKPPYSIPIAECILRRLHAADEAGEDDGTSKHRVVEEGIQIAAQSIAHLIRQGARNINLMAVRKPETYQQILSLVPAYAEQGVVGTTRPFALSPVSSIEIGIGAK